MEPVCEACCRDLELKESFLVHTKDAAVSIGFWTIQKFTIGLLSLNLIMGLFGCSIKQQNTALDISTTATVPSTVENTAIAPTFDLRPPADGFYLVSNGGLVAIPGLSDDSSLDLGSLPSTTENPPTFSVKGDSFPLGILFLNPYIAGIGVDLKYNESNATITKVYDNSPAQAAGLQIGDLIISVNDVPLKIDLISQFYTPIPIDLLGPMSDRLKLEVITGTNSRVLELPRTYTATVHPEWISITFPAINFQVEPRGDYVLIHVTKVIELGAYRFEFVAPYSGTSCGLCLPNTGGIGTFPSPTPPPTPTPTPTSVPILIPAQKWAFILR